MTITCGRIWNVNLLPQKIKHGDFLSSSQETGCEKHLQNDLFCVEWDIKPKTLINAIEHGD